MKRILLTAIQVAITVFLLWWIFRDPKKNQAMLTALSTADYWWLIPGLLSIGCAFLLQTQRWRLLLGVQGIHLGWWRTLHVYLIGAFFNLFLLGSTGGDVVKIYYAMRETASRKSAAFLSVLVDRMMGLIALVAVTAVFCGMRLPLLMSKPVTQALLSTLVILMAGSIGLIIFGFIVDRFHLAHKLPSWLPLRSKIVDFSAVFSVYARDPRVLFATFCLSIPAHLFMFLSFYFSARAFHSFAGMKGLLDIFSVLPIIQTIASLPISFAGVGLREKLFEQVFSELFGTPESLSVMISISGFLMLVFWGIIGGLVYLAYRPSGGLHVTEMQAEVSEIEKTLDA